MKELYGLYKEYTGSEPELAVALTGSGSNRRYVRLSAPEGSYIGVTGTDVLENKAFLTIARHFRQKGIPVPEVLVVSADGMSYLQEDLGDVLLSDMVARAGKEGWGDMTGLLCRTMAILPKIQFEGAAGLDFSICYPQPSFDRRMIMFDLNYFKYCFLKPSGVEFNEVRLQDDFERFADELLKDDSDTFLYRDFNARNVMIRDGNPYFIDFQGGRRGPVYYDVASFVWQARARYPQWLKERMLESYVSALTEYIEVDRKNFDERLRLFVLFRTLQVLGAYGFRGLVENKAQFVVSIPPAIEGLKELLSTPFADYPYLNEVLCRMASIPKFATSPSDGRLEVKVMSFSYKKGVPQDMSGNGGGYLFDCRSIHNPGRYEPYKKLTGRDEPVIRFLEDDGEILHYLDHVYAIVDQHIETYAGRGFTDLMVGFGCTGGQHRSVYCAEHMAYHIAERYPDVRVRLIHREQNISTVIPSPARNLSKALIFAAGLGTRLKPLTDTIPKALVPVGGIPLIEHVSRKLKASGVKEAVVNVHHFADMVEEWVERQDIMKMDISDERGMLLETGGGVLHARPLLEGCGRFLIHNVDILSDLDIGWFESCVKNEAIATLLTSDRKTSRYLLFDTHTMRLKGWMNVNTGEVRSSYPDLDPSGCVRLAFSGIHILSDKVFDLLEIYAREKGLYEVGGTPRFPIMDFYLSVCDKYPIYGVKADGLRLVDVGKLDTIELAEQSFK